MTRSSTLREIADRFPDSWETIEASEFEWLFWSRDDGIHVGLESDGCTITVSWSDADGGATTFGDLLELPLSLHTYDEVVASVQTFAGRRSPDAISVEALAEDLDVTTDDIDRLVDQLLWVDGKDHVVNSGGKILPDAAAAIGEQVRAAAEERDTWIMVRGVENFAASVREREQQLSDAVEARDEAIREAHRRGARVTDLATAAGLHRVHVHRIIRDG